MRNLKVAATRNELTDSDLPAHGLTYILDLGAPPGASVDAKAGACVSITGVLAHEVTPMAAKARRNRKQPLGMLVTFEPIFICRG